MNKRKSKPVYLVEGARTPIGSPFRGFKELSAAQLAVAAIRETLKRAKLTGHEVDELILGNVVSAGTGQNLARQAGVGAGLPISVPAFTVNNVCGAGLQSVILAAQAIKAGDANVIIAGGTESLSQAPKLLYFNEDKTKERTLDSFVQDGLFCNLTNRDMGHHADHLARKFKVSRKEQDLYAYQSHVKACLAQDAGKFASLIPVNVKSKKAVIEDERPRRSISFEKLAALPPAFGKEGTATAGNVSVPCDSAADVVVVSEEALKEFKLKPKAVILGYSSIAVEPMEVFTAGIDSVKACLKECGLSLSDMDFFEISESFASQAIVEQRELKIPDSKMNIWGGDIALGHALGAAGTRILVTLMDILIDQKKKRGLASICLGGGGAVTMVIERL